MEDFVESMLNLGGGGEGEESEEGEQLPAADATQYKSKNLDAERRRRGRLNNNILALRAVVPNITKVLPSSYASSSLPAAINCTDHTPTPPNNWAGQRKLPVASASPDISVSCMRAQARNEIIIILYKLLLPGRKVRTQLTFLTLIDLVLFSDEQGVHPGGRHRSHQEAPEPGP